MNCVRAGWDSIIHPDDLPVVEDQLKVLLDGQSKIVQYRIITSKDNVRWLLDCGQPEWDKKQSRVTHIYGAVQDITEMKQAEKELQESEQKYRLLVENANEGIAVAQDGVLKFVNPNNFVSFNIPILRDFIKEMIPIIEEYAAERPEFDLCHLKFPEFRQDIFKLLDNVENGSDRISAFVTNLREFSQDKDMKPLIWVELEDVIERVLSICHSKIKNSVKSFIKNVPENLPSIRTEPYVLEQILLNLLVNAIQAVDKKDSWIKLIVSVVDGRQDQLCIEVSDNGCGMDEETRLKIFDPFFTTKSQVDGTGLGLYVCHTMVERLKARIEVESEPGKGSSFKLILPVENKN